MKTKTLSAPIAARFAAASVLELGAVACAGDTAAAFSSPSLSSTTETNSANSHVPIIVGIGEDAESLDPAAAGPGSISAAVILHVYERMQLTVDGVIL